MIISGSLLLITLTCSGILENNTLNVLLKKLVKRGFNGGGVSRNANILSNNVVFEKSFSRIYKLFNQLFCWSFSYALTWGALQVITFPAMLGNLNLNFSSKSWEGSRRIKSSRLERMSCLDKLNSLLDILSNWGNLLINKFRVPVFTLVHNVHLILLQYLLQRDTRLVQQCAHIGHCVGIGEVLAKHLE